MAASDLPLEGLYLHLVRSGFPLSARDFTDALAALRAGYGLQGRGGLQRLCETLWARTEDEVARLDRLFRAFPWPSAEQVRDASGGGLDLESADPSGSRGNGAPRTPLGPARAEGPGVAFAPPQATGVGLARARVPTVPSSVYVMNPRPAIAMRHLIVALRRFRVAKRSGPRLELDVDATIAEQCRCGTLVEPVFAPARCNQARLIVLVDASPSMTAWRPMNRLLTEALEASRFAHAKLYFFDNVPSGDLYEDETLTEPVPVAAAHDKHPGCALLVVSDAGAARGRRDPARIVQTRAFVARVWSQWQPIAWVNPMPSARWQGTGAEDVARMTSLAMFEQSDEGLTRAVDWLRGKQAV